MIINSLYINIYGNDFMDKAEQRAFWNSFITIQYSTVRQK